MKIEKKLTFQGDDRYTNNIRDRIAGLAMEAYAELVGGNAEAPDWSGLPEFSERNSIVLTVEVAAPAKKGA